ncbi:MAG TPA: endopeptidase La [Candidatus Polarisedimenticolaceae bacterium]|nr:endopeptidase La [Candidatus Polarisedimenticolaceae bacterium]
MQERQRRSTDAVTTLPMVPLRDIVVFPHTMVPFVVGRRGSLLAVEQALGGDKQIFLSTQRNAKVDSPKTDEINSVGTVATIVQHLKLPNGNVKLLVEGSARARILEIEEDAEGFFRVVLKAIERQADMTPELQQTLEKVALLFQKFMKTTSEVPYDTATSSVKITDPARLADTIAAHLPIGIDEKQALLETVAVTDRLAEVERLLESELEKLRVDKKITNRVKKQMEKAQKEYYLNEKIKAIQQELGRKDERVNEIDEFRQKIEAARMPDEAKEKALQELKRLEVMPPVSAEATVSRNYLEWLLAVPWSKKSRELIDIKRAEKILDEDHHGLEKIKERILEFLAVRRLVKKMKGSILCFVGPPGVGKTSLARSIARATGREFVRLSLGGVRDEAEIRGHRRTYIGAFPGQIIQMMKKAGTRNPVFLLDEVDKMAADFRGDPSAALLEVLDPEQNHAFLDHYLDTEYDLSDIMFIATANVMHTIPPALRDRMEVIRIAGYTLNEKLSIAQRYLVPKQIKAHGLQNAEITFEDAAVLEIAERYTREAGVRNLEREIASLCRKIARRVVAGEAEKPIVMTAAKVVEMLGVPHYHPPREIERQPAVGVATGLAWTETGGEILTTEATRMAGRGKITLTGQLGEVMQESAQAALSYIRARAEELGIDPHFYRKYDVHVHVPEGAIPKDGPSAGITMATALASLMTGVPVRGDVAMTGEITLRGKVLPIGGLKEKVLAAYRYGTKTLVIPRENERDLSEIPDDIRKMLTFHLVDDMDEVLEIALAGPLPGAGLGDGGSPQGEGRSESEGPVTH